MQEETTVGNLKNIVNGPYLLAPLATGMTVSWETNVAVSAKIWYGTKGQLDSQMDVECEWGTPWKENYKGICMYRAALKNLAPGMVYQYKVELESGEVADGTFKTLSDNPNRIRIITLSDSHLFKINREFTDMVRTNKPDFLIHSGDISLATGYQKDEYSTNWFHPGAEFLKEVPAVYVSGNHDISPYYEDFFLNVQKDNYHSDKTGHNSSFTYGNTHIVFLDSTPWGLFEMNAVNSALPVDDVTRNRLDITMNWLQADLKTPEAQQATWRILVLHHPYTDDFTYKHIVGLGEKYNINLVIAGHVHYYIKNVSVDPTIGAKTVYISQGSAEEYGTAIEYGKEEERLLTEFPEVIATGTVNYGEIVIEDDSLVFTAYGFEKEGAKATIVDEVRLVKEEPYITLDDIAVTEDRENRKIIIEGIAKNEGHGLAVVLLKIMDNGEGIFQNLLGYQGKERIVALNPGEKRKIRGEYALVGAGEHVIQVGNVRKVIDVLPLEPISFDNMTIKVGQEQNSNVAFVTVEVTNNQETEKFTNVKLYVDNHKVATQTLKLISYEKKVMEFSYSFTKGGVYQVGIEKLEPKTITIEGTLKGTPIIKDLSGNGNHGLLRGTPKINYQGERVTVSLDHDGDYIEIPDSESLSVEDGYTGLVWANLNRLATLDEMGHNPLMVKGISTGWGVTYLVRMAVERGGNIKWGTCYGTTEYSWQGGRAPVGKWVQYTSTFDKKAGGASYCNEQRVAETIGIGPHEKLCNWKGLPIFVGYSYIGHIIKEIGRPKYFTHLCAKISQIRFYKRKISEEENQYIYEHPNEIGKNSKELAVWLDFRDIETKGRHITEWRRPAIFQPAFKADKKYWHFTSIQTDTCLSGLASLKAIVQVSDDGETIKDAKEINLVNGKQEIELSELEKAQYVRVITEFESSITEDGTYIPEVNEYKITASSNQVITELTWGTRVDWQRGTMEGAIGFEPLNRTKVFNEYTDVIHG